VDFGLWFSSSLLADRASWMTDRLAVLGDRPLSALVLPASHDSAMYTEGISLLGQTQKLSLYGQLNNGIRWFDLRPRWTGSKFVVSHGIIDGPDLSDVLTDIARFADEGRRELILIKLSHFDNIDNTVYEKLTKQITDAIGTWLVTEVPAGKRLADVTLAEYTAEKKKPAIIVVVDGNYAIDKPKKGLWVYRDWQSGDPARGDLRVYDVYSDKIHFDEMAIDQGAKFANYNGMCKNAPTVPCDLFLLSWTLTPVTAVWLVSQPANRALGDAMASLTARNKYGKIVNLLYVDYVEFARVSDVGLYQNGTPRPAPLPRPASAGEPVLVDAQL
jgi:hypothetical protein